MKGFGTGTEKLLSVPSCYRNSDNNVEGSADNVRLVSEVSESLKDATVCVIISIKNLVPVGLG